MTNKKETPRDFRKKIKRAEQSRDVWKDKNKKNQYEIKKMQALLRALKNNRDEWRTKTQNASHLILELEKELETNQAEKINLQKEVQNYKELESIKKKGMI